MLCMIQVPEDPLMDLSDEELDQVERAESELNDNQWDLFRHFIERGRDIKTAFDMARKSYFR